MNFLVVTYTPSRQGLLGVIQPNVNLDQLIADSKEELRDRLSVPLGGYCLLIKEEDITTITSSIVNTEAQTLPEIQIP